MVRAVSHISPSHTSTAPISQDHVGPLGEPTGESGVCQLQLMRLVQMPGAIASYLIYHQPLSGQWVCGQATQTAPATVPALFLPAQMPALLAHLDAIAQEAAPGLWAFQGAVPGDGAGHWVGLRFCSPLDETWAYLMVQGDRPRLPADPLALQPELEFLKTAIFLDQQLWQQQQQAAQAQRILRQIEHQLRNPLAVIHLYAANLQRSLPNPADRQRAIAIGEAVQHLTDHLSEMIGGCQRQQVQADWCEVRSLLQEVWRGLGLAVQTQQAELHLPAAPLRLWGDRAQLLQLFENLLHNALCFSPEQGQIRVNWQEFQRETLITITDQGTGLSAEDLQQMFRPYYSKRPQGTGLGLAIAQHIIQGHGGRIWADNLPQGGAQFSLVFPRHRPTV